MTLTVPRGIDRIKVIPLEKFDGVQGCTPLEE
jgi:hypothetical protein